MFEPKGALRALAMLCVATLLPLAVAAQPYSVPQTVYLPSGKAPVVRVTSVSSILAHFTAADLELKTGDLIFAIDGMAVDSAEQFSKLFEDKRADGHVRIDFLRDGVVHQSVGPLFRFTRGIFRSDKPRWGGGLETTTADFPPSLLKTPVVRSILGMKISYVKAGSAADNAGLQKGDSLLSINGRSIGRVSFGDTLIPLFPEGTPLTFIYLRDGKQASGTAPLTKVKTGFSKILTFGLGGESHMVQLPGNDLPEEAPKNVTIEMPA